ncbi:hypothetical protein BG004_005330 [Podila humilis]|nr:hypothetical protein BG004_005330 [Podila humilis]
MQIWYQLAINAYKPLRDGSPYYDQSGDWRAKYEAAKKEEDERFERVGAKLRRSYSQLDKNRQGRSVIVDPNLRLPRAAIRSSTGGTHIRKPTTLFEKARREARRITQMYSSGPIPVKTRYASTGGTGRTVSSSQSHITSQRTHQSLATPSGVKSGSRHILAPSSVFATNTTRPAQAFMGSRNSHGAMDNGLIALTPSAQVAPTTKARYSYKAHPVVHTNTPRLNLGQKQYGSNDHSRPPTKPSQTSPPISSSAHGALVDFFKQLNPEHSHSHSHSTTASGSGTDSQASRSPTSPTIPSSTTIQQLRSNDVPPKSTPFHANSSKHNMPSSQQGDTL